MVVKDALMDVMREIAIMKKLSHENIVRLHEVIDDPENDKLYLSISIEIVIDFAESGQLVEWNEDENIFEKNIDCETQYFSEKFLKGIIRECLKGIFYRYFILKSSFQSYYSQRH